MKTNIKKSVRIASFMLGMSTIFGAVTMGGYHFTKHYRNKIEYTYLKTLDDLSEYISKLEVSFSKIAV